MDTKNSCNERIIVKLEINKREEKKKLRSHGSLRNAVKTNTSQPICEHEFNAYSPSLSQFHIGSMYKTREKRKERVVGVCSRKLYKQYLPNLINITNLYY